VIGCAFLVCSVLLPLQGQQSDSLKTESDLIVALVKADKAQGEVAKLLETHTSLVTANLWEQLIALASQVYYQNPEKAFVVYDVARQIAVHLKDQRRQGKTYYNIARSYSGLGRYESATSNYLESKKAFEAAGSERDVIYVLSELGSISWVQERYAEARQYSEASLNLAETFKGSRAPAGTWPDAFGIAQSLLTLGQLSARDGEYDLATTHLMRALDLLNELNTDHGYDFYVTEIYAALGRVYTSAGDHIAALQYLNSALKTAAGGQIPNLLNSLGYLYLEQEDYPQANAQFQQSLKLYRSAKNQKEESRVLLNLGVVQQREGNHDEALKFLAQGLETARATKLIDVEMAALEGVGVVLTAQKRFDDALAALNGGLAVAREFQDKLRQTELLWRVAQTYYQMQDYARAVEFAQKAVELARVTHLPKLTYLANVTLGDSYAASNRIDLAVQTLKDAIDLVETLRDRVAGREEGLQLFFENKVGAYHSLTRLLVQQGKFFDALVYAERAKSRVLLDIVRSGKGNLQNALNESEKVEWQSLVRKVSAINERTKAQAGTEAESSRLKKELDAARLELASFEDKIYVTHPELRLRSGTTQPLTVASLTSLVAGNDVAYLEYVVTNDRVGLFLVKRNRVTNALDVSHVDLDMKTEDLRAKVNEFHSMLAQRHPGYRTLSRELYELLIKPVAKQLHGIKTIFIVPDGLIWTSPFQALITERDRYLIEEYALGYAPSLSVLQEMNKNRRNSKSVASIIAFGNPVIGRDEKLNQDLCPLPEAETEVKEIASVVRSRAKEVFVGPTATEKTFKSLAPEYVTIHLATHGVLDNRDPLYSHLLLTKTDGDIENDGSLEAREIMNMHLNAELAVLSACETANGRISPGEGVIGMSWAFFVAGTRSMVVSQWRVNSASTAQLMKNFYEALAMRQNAYKSEALRQASLRLLKDPRYRHPFYWAGFVLVGRN
jgi:CHAT domain-containing protein/tetratricopeptide (TPR) repeat protein